MKKIFVLFYCILSYTISTNAQEIITGIGKFKMYSSINVIAELGFTKIKEVKTAADYAKMRFKKLSKNSIYEIFLDTLKGERVGFDTYFNPNVRQFFVNSYEITPEIILKNISLTYYKDSLISIHCSDSYFESGRNVGIEKINEIFKDKYVVTDSKTEKKEYGGSVISYYYKTDRPNLSCCIWTNYEHDIYGNIKSIMYLLWFDDSIKKFDLERIEREFDKRITNRKYSNSGL